MLASIHPLGERARHSRWGITAAAHVVGGAAGGLMMGAIAGTAGWALRGAAPWGATTAVAAVVVIGLAGAAFDALPGLPLPSPRRQVNEDWLTRYRGWVYGLGFGFQLGLGVATIVTSALVYVVVALAALTASPAGGGLVGLAFGAARGATVLLPARVRQPEQLRRLHRRLAAAAPAMRMAAVTGQAVLALLALVVLL